MKRQLCFGFLVCAAVAYAQDPASTDGPVGAQLNLATGPVPVTVRLGLPPGTGPAQDQALTDALSLAPGLAYHSSSFSAFGSFSLPFNFIGADPSVGASTTTIPTVIVPLQIVFASNGQTLDGTNRVSAVINSPIFQTADYTAGGVDLGVTQYGDALLRAEFWNLPGFSQNYHVLLGQPTVLPTVTLTIPAAYGNAYLLSNGGYEGVIDDSYFESIIRSLAIGYPANQLPIFLTDNVNLGTGGLLSNCCTVGYHASQGPPAATARTWIYAAYEEPGSYAGSEVGLSWVDVVPLSHEVAEWLNDPFVGSFTFGFLNFVPPAALTNGTCAINFETGDPLENRPYTFSKVTNATTYHLQDEVFLPWYLHSTPSFSVNGWYTFQNLSAQVPLVVNSPASIAGSYPNTATMAFAPVNAAVTADVVYVGRGCPGDTYLANPTGKIALIDRGTCGISVKVDAAANAGAVGVLLALVAPGNPLQFTYAGGTNFVPSLVLTQADSASIKALLGISTVNATISPSNAIPAPFSNLCAAGGPG